MHKVKGEILSISKIETGETKKEKKKWSKLSFRLKTDEKYNNLYSFDIFQMDDSEPKYKQVDNFHDYYKIKDTVEVDFIVQCREYNDKYYTNLSLWNIKKADKIETKNDQLKDDLPF